VLRHRFGAAAGVVVLLSLVVGIAATMWQASIAEAQRSRAEQRFAEVRQLSSDFLFEFHDAIVDLPASTPARELVVRRGLEYLDRLSREPGNDRALQRELATAYRKIADVQGNPTNANLGRTGEALDSYGKAREIAAALVASDPRDFESRQILANVYDRMGDVEAAMGDLDAANTSKQRAVDLYRELARHYPDERQRQIDLAVSLIKIGDLTGNPHFPNLGKPDAALEFYVPARAIVDSCYELDPSNERLRRLRGVIYERIGTINTEQNDVEEALKAYRISAETREAYAADNPSETDAVRDLAIAHEKMGTILLKMNRLDESLERYLKSLEIFKQLERADPRNAQARQSLAISYLHVGDIHGRPDQPNLGNPREALENYRRSLALMEEVYAFDTTNAHARFLLDLVKQRVEDVQ
jgi:tetratricopeptide (TPR) repeat protein